ncbi:3-hydroxymethyl-3-methylglutaryl-CoA lyase [Ceratobasidium sp. AG-Ba]|nr:3-hydroxymethyl-3-methylglutaryl-CoA lyase [Ceratobasidium sp. AG-Ba]
MALFSCSRRTATRGLAYTLKRTLATPADNFVRIVEVGPRDGLQNEPTAIPKDVKVELINRLGAAGAKIIEAGSFVSPKWMAGTAEVISQMKRIPGVRYPVLVPNMKGLDTLLTLLSQHSSSSPPLTDEVAIFTAASDGFNKANTNSTVAESLVRLAPVVQRALENGLRVRGYISTVISCPYDGETDPRRVKDVARELVQMGCYEVSLGDTVGTGTPASMLAMLNEVVKDVPIRILAAHNHDTFGMGISNVMAAVEAGVRTVDSSVAGLGGCPYSPGATGNVATEDVVHALHGCGYKTGIDLPALVHVGAWISKELKRDNSSRAGRAYLAREIRAKNARPAASLS